MAAVTASPTAPELLEALLRWLLATPVVSPPDLTPVPSELVPLLQRLLGDARPAQSAPPGKSGITAMEILLQNSWAQPDTGRRDWTTVLCFSCGKMDQGATRCTTFDTTFPFLLSGKVGSGYVMISPRVMVERLRAENGD